LFGDLVKQILEDSFVIVSLYLMDGEDMNTGTSKNSSINSFKEFSNC